MILMKKYLRKENILIGILFVLIGILSLTLHTEKTKIVTPVSMKYADRVKDKCKGTKGTYNDTSGETVDKYDIQFEINSSNKLKVSVNPEDKNSKVLAQLRKAKRLNRVIKTKKYKKVEKTLKGDDSDEEVSA